MNIPIKVLKSPNGLPSQILNFHQILAKKYHKIQQKKSNSNKSEGDKDETAVEICSKIYQLATPGLQEETLKWFFSLPFEQRFKICSVQNKWLVNIIHQLYFHFSSDSRVKFQMRNNNSSEEVEEIFPNFIYANNINNGTFINLNVNSLYGGEGVNCLNSTYNNNINSYLNYFIPNNDCQTTIVLNRYIENNESMEYNFLKEIKFIKSEEHNDTLTLALNILTSETSLKKYFDYFTNNKYFSSGITVAYDSAGKLYNFSMPEWKR